MFTISVEERSSLKAWQAVGPTPHKPQSPKFGTQISHSTSTSEIWVRDYLSPLQKGPDVTQHPKWRPG